jgi:hypothetical protein
LKRNTQLTKNFFSYLFLFPPRTIVNFLKLFIIITIIIAQGCSSSHHSTYETDLNDPSFKISLPKQGWLKNDKPVGKNWVNLISSLEDWNASKEYWKLDNGVLHGDYMGGKYHNYAYTKTAYKDFELQALVRMTGKEANSGVCIRLHATDADNAPGYQIDMGPGYWGCLWEERRAGMVQQYPKELAAKLVKENDWNHYYVIAKDHHIQAWLNGVKTIDTIHVAGFDEGTIGLQLCHGDKHTVLDVKCLYIRPLK